MSAANCSPAQRPTRALADRDKRTAAGAAKVVHVALNLTFLGPRAGGVGRYARELPGGLLAADPRTRIAVIVARNHPPDLREEPWAPHVRWLKLPLDAASLGVQAGQHLTLPLIARAAGCDVLHSPANVGPVLTAGLASVVSVMDLIWLLRPDEWDPDPRAQRAIRRQVRWCLRHADRVLAISHATAADLVARLGVPPRRIVVTPLGVRAARVAPTPAAELRARLGLGRSRILLCVAQKRPYKNLERLVRALPALDDHVVLVLPGSSSPYERHLRGVADQLRVAQRVRFPEWLSEADLAGLYGCSAAFALPSLIEGFGLPVLEAMAHGLPVACSDIPALREVAEDAALLFDPQDQAAVDAALRRVLSDSELAGQLIARGPRRAAEFSWRRTGEATLEGYRQALASRGRQGRH